MSRDELVFALLVTAFAALVTAHVALCFGVAARQSREQQRSAFCRRLPSSIQRFLFQCLQL